MNFDLGKVVKKNSQFSPSSMFFSPIFILDFHLFKVWHEHLGEVDVRVTHLLDPRMESLGRASCILDLLLMKRLIRNTNRPPLSCPPQGSSGVCPSCSDYLQAAFTFMPKPCNGSNAVPQTLFNTSMTLLNGPGSTGQVQHF